MLDSLSEQGAYHELCAYTLTRGDPRFIHQYVVDAYAAQHATAESKRIGLAFALIGLYLHLERGYSGRQVQLAHMRLARKRKEWPTFDLPEQRGSLTVFHALEAAPGAERDRALREWSASVWHAWQASHSRVVDLLRELGE